MIRRASLLGMGVALLASLFIPITASALTPTQYTQLRPIADSYNNWIVKPNNNTLAAWTAIDEQVTDQESVAATDWLWAGGAGRVAEVAMSYPAYAGMQPATAAAKFYANTGASTQLLVETVACGKVTASMTVGANQGFAWRTLHTNANKLYCGATGQDQRMRLRFTTIGGGDSNIRAAYVNVGLAPSETMATVMAYNIEEHTDPETANFWSVVSTIRGRNADIVLLNEVKMKSGYVINGVDQMTYLAQQSGYPYWTYHPTTNTGWTGTKGVAVLSRFPILDKKTYQVPVAGASFGILQTTMNIKGYMTEVFSLRFSPMHRLWLDGPKDTSYDANEWPSNEAGHALAKQLARGVPGNRAVIMGGDFNATWRHAYAGSWPVNTQTPWTVDFRDTSGLKDALVEYERPYGGAWDGRVDYIYYRGPYVAKQTISQFGYSGASDHAYVQTTLGFSELTAIEMATSGSGSMDQ